MHPLYILSAFEGPHAVPKAQPRPTSGQSDKAGQVAMVSKKMCVKFSFQLFNPWHCLDQWLCEQPASSSPCTATVLSKDSSA